MSTATITWKNRVVPPCAACGTEGGKITKGLVRPARRDGAPFGLPGKICKKCFSRLHSVKMRRDKKLGLLAPKQQAAGDTALGRLAASRLRAAAAFLPVVSGCPCRRFRMRFRTECDLCGVGGAISLYSGAEFEIEGRICWQCREELRDERAEIRHRELGTVACLSMASEDSHASRKVCLPVLTPGFTRWDLAPRAAAALILAETKGVFPRRAAG